MSVVITKKPIILIVDDTPSNIQVLAEALQADYLIRVAGSGRMALEIIAKKGPPDLILLDVMMPELDGYTVCKRLKADPIVCNVPVVFVTAKNEHEDEEYGLSLGAIDYITKPFHLPIVTARIRNHINLKLKSDLLEQLARFDGLTNIPNRRHFDENFSMEWKRAQRNCLPLSLILLDIDYFKPFNDNYGHGGGDLCLAKVAAKLATVIVRPGDLLARYGGEEFVVLLPETAGADALLVAERMCEAVASLRLTHEYSKAAAWVTISAGVAGTMPILTDIPEVLLQGADQQLYRAKAMGRNRACVAA